MTKGLLSFGYFASLSMTARTLDTTLCHIERSEISYQLKRDTSHSLSMTNLGKSPNLIVCHTQILGTKFTNFTRFYGLLRSLCLLAMTARRKFKFFTQNSKHFINSTHFINLSQNLSHTQGFFISLPQIFEQFLLINLVERRSYGNKKTEK